MICFTCENSFSEVRKDQKYCCKSCYIKGSNKERKIYKQIWAEQNKVKVDSSKRNWIIKNPEKRKEASSSYTKRNKPYYAQYSSLRTRKVQQAKPKQVDEDDLLNVYKEAEYFGLEVDHIIPITHELVCGLHVWNNLQLLTRSENAMKSNKFFIEDILAIIKE